MVDKAKLLVVDDEEVICEACRRILTPQGFWVETSTNAIDGLFSASQQDYAVILLDVKMAPLDGISFLDHLRKVKPEAPVIFITGHPTVQNAAAAMRLGAIDFLTKPFTAEDLICAVQKSLRPWNASSPAQISGMARTLATWAPANTGRRFWGDSWLQLGEDGSARCGSLGARSREAEITAVRLPRIGETVYQGLPLAGFTTADDNLVAIPSPVSGVVVAVNERLTHKPSLLADHAFARGWIARVYPSRLAEELDACQARRVLLLNSDTESALVQSKGLSLLGCDVKVVAGWNSLTPAALEADRTLLILDAASFARRGPELVRRINVVAPSLKVVVLARPDSRYEAAYRQNRIFYYAVRPFADGEITDILDAAFRVPNRPVPSTPCLQGHTGGGTTISVTNGTGRQVRLIAEDEMLHPHGALCRELTSRLTKQKFRVEVLGTRHASVSAFAVRQEARNCDRLLVLVARDAGRLPGSLVRDTLHQLTSELCDNVWNATPLVVQPARKNGRSLEFDEPTVAALANHIAQETALCYECAGHAQGVASDK